MKLRIKNLLLPLTLVAALHMTSCNENVEPESLTVRYPSLEETDPELYQQYMQSLRDYKSGSHKVVFVTMENPAAGAAPTLRNQHVTNMPDSVDFISLNNPAQLHPVTVEEMQKIHEKGTRTIYNISFPAMEGEWIQMIKEDSRLTEADALVYFTQRTAEQLAYCDKWNFDGITFQYVGRAPSGLKEAELIAYRARQNAFLAPILAWRETHSSKFFAFMGNAANVLEENRTVLTDCDYLIVPTDNVKNADELTVRVMAAVSGVGIPSDRVVITAQTTRPGDDKHLYGYFSTTDSNGKQIRSIFGCANWVSLPSTGYFRAGLLINDAQYDYFNQLFVYPAIREAIGIMNPSI